MGLNATIAMAGRSLEVFSTGIQVAGQNISNSATPGYVREELRLQPSGSYRSGSLVFGTGVVVDGIRQTIDQFLETRLHSANSDSNASSARDTIYKALEGTINELGNSDLSTSISKFFGSIQNLSTQPDSVSSRQSMIAQGQQLANDIGSLRGEVDQLRTDQSVKVDSLVAEANDLIEQVARLNPQITKLESSGLLKSDAGDLRTQRLTALNRLSQIIPIKFAERQDGGVDVFTGSEYLVLNNHTQQLVTQTGVDRGVQVQQVTLSETTAPVPLTGGELAGVIQGRDEILGGFVDDLDKLTSNLIQEVNRIHASGQGLIGFNSVTGTTNVLDTTSPLNQAGLAFPPSHGSFQLIVTNQATGAATTTTVPIDLDGIDPANDTSLQSFRNSINTNIPNVTASITADGLFQLKAADGYDIKFANDTSGVLTSLGINTFFSGTDSHTIEVNSVLRNDSRLLATGQGGGPSDGTNALALGNFLQNPLSGLQGQTLDGYYSAMLTTVTQGSASEGAASTAYSSLVDSLRSQRDQTSGVSLDEEAIKLMGFQRSFQAAARIISTVDELYTILLQM